MAGEWRERSAEEEVEESRCKKRCEVNERGLNLNSKSLSEAIDQMSKNDHKIACFSSKVVIVLFYRLSSQCGLHANGYEMIYNFRKRCLEIQLQKAFQLYLRRVTSDFDPLFIIICNFLTDFDNFFIYGFLTSSPYSSLSSFSLANSSFLLVSIALLLFRRSL